MRKNSEDTDLPRMLRIWKSKARQISMAMSRSWIASPGRRSGLMAVMSWSVRAWAAAVETEERILMGLSFHRRPRIQIRTEL